MVAGHDPHDDAVLNERLLAEKVRIHYDQIPGMILAPTLGGLFSSWVLWDAVDNRWLVFGMGLVFLLSAARGLACFHFRQLPRKRQTEPRWRYIAIMSALLSGLIWGSAAVVLYPPLRSEYLVYLVVVLALIPVLPIAALAVYPPTFYAYYIPSLLPFVVILLSSDNRPEQLTGLLLLIASGATINFAMEYAKSLNESLRLRILLGDKTDALEHAARVKTRFLAAASHDLRQPVHAMGLFLEALRSHLHEPETRELLENADSSLQGLRRMLSEILDISRLDAEVVRVDRRFVPLCPLLQNLAQEYLPQAREKGLQLRLRCPQRPVTVLSDASHLERILRNLLENAIKYTTHGGILLACRRQGERVRIQIIDTGRGIANERLDEIFLEFTQIDNPARDASQGLGLGLAIAQRLARLLGHEIHVCSRPGRGTVFSLTLKACVEPTSANATAHQSIPPAGDALHSLGMVLIIDDDPAIRTGTATLLQQWGCHVQTAGSAEQAISQLRRNNESPDVLIVDYRLANDLTALDAINRLETFLGKALPTIIITGDTDPERVREAHDSGHLLLHKPLDPERLRLCLIMLAEATDKTEHS